MDTIHESTGRMAVMSGVWPEATTTTTSGTFPGLAGPSRSRTEPIVSTAANRPPETASSMKSPVARKTSFRVPKWVKRSGSSRTTTASVRSAPEAWKPQIKHLGGGRVEEVDVQSIGSAISNNNSNSNSNSNSNTPQSSLLVPGSSRGKGGPMSDTSSIDSRATRWFDFYKEPPSEPGKSQAKPPPLRPKPSDDRLPSRQQDRSPSPLTVTDLRPAPLRLPSSERSRSPRTPPPNTPLPDTSRPTPLTRKDSKYKPLPVLPTQQAGLSSARAEGGSVALDKAEPGSSERKNKHEPVPSPSSQSQRGRGVSPSPQQHDWAFVAPPAIHVDTPPPTPGGTSIDSIVGAYGGCKDKSEGERIHVNDGGAPAPVPNSQIDSASNTTVKEVREEDAKTRLPLRPAERVDSLRHTRQERIWLHVNYRGEAPFLKAWGLDIRKRSDRLEGLAILRELIHAEAQERKKGAGGASEEDADTVVGVQGGRD
ncbi:hypothetical protein C8A03DRAFT_32398 [Achaetomium macrosporum]|uniref:Uncharacterized protein n=1 Tax=Achaetomium macrosporum TaxID=79813 RepID=A0AAN7HGI0_9PEZI|nr:hypothetical protein C8A03DRAFT_32398 [Achaetomium macrosporum]